MVRDRINQRYYAGRISNDLAAAGVIVHAFDGGLAYDRPWTDGGQGFVSASLLNAMKTPHGLYTGDPALIVSPSSRVLCSYPQDSGTKSWRLPKVSVNGCGPSFCGRDARAYSGTDQWPRPRHDAGYPCAFPPNMFATMMSIFYNATVDESAYTEIVVDNEPQTFAVEAVVSFNLEDKGRARTVHRKIIEHWGLNAHQLPLLRWGPGLKDNNKCRSKADCPLVCTGWSDCARYY